MWSEFVSSSDHMSVYLIPYTPAQKFRPQAKLICVQNSVVHFYVCCMVGKVHLHSCMCVAWCVQFSVCCMGWVKLSCQWHSGAWDGAL